MSNVPASRPRGTADGRLLVRLLLIALAMSVVMAGTALWVLRRPAT